ncbi:tyrosine-type DNA invertase [Enterobacter asburiae]|uniref:tyrosine-type DNA invertase n=1 Tax=Enterobacter asburiae TaxID=61645 RepID=UPI001FFEC3B3|nr:tyrosine-type DNA invertase [Enterobacter asburiae]MCK2177813.1 tyrosine-type DNA invertase [Enterobacter asburiae]
MQRRRYLSGTEVELLISSAARKETGERDQCLIYMAFIHGYRISELLSLTFSDIDFNSNYIHIKRSKQGFSTIHPLLHEERQLLLKWLTVRICYQNAQESPYVFISRRGTPLSRQQAYNIVKSAGSAARLSVKAHPHMLRHACGYALADRGINTRLIQDYLGHRNIRHTVHYTASNAGRFVNIWGSESGEAVCLCESHCSACVRL